MAHQRSSWHKRFEQVFGSGDGVLDPSSRLPSTSTYQRVRRRSFVLLSLATGIGLAWTHAPAIPQTFVTQVAADPLVQEGLSAYRQGQFQAAIDLWQQALAIYQQRGDRIQQAHLLNNLSAALQQLSRWSEAQQQLNQSLSLLEDQQGSSASVGSLDAPDARQPQGSQSSQASQGSQGSQGSQAAQGSPTQERLRLRVLAQALNTQGSLQLGIGDPESAFATWQRASQTYAQAQDLAGQIGSRINQVQALQALGLNQQARAILDDPQLQQQIDQLPDDSEVKITALSRSGYAYRVLGVLPSAISMFEEALTLAEQSGNRQLQQEAGLDLAITRHAQANLAREISDWKTAQEQTDQALDLYQEVARAARSDLTSIQATLNQLTLLLDNFEGLQIRTQQIQPEIPLPPGETPVDLEQLLEANRTSIQSLWPQMLNQVADLAPSRSAIYTRINLAIHLLQWRQLQLQPSTMSISRSSRSSESLPELDHIDPLLLTALQQANQIGDQPPMIYGLGIQGSLRQQQDRLPDAKAITESALFQAQLLQSNESIYRWQSQLGDILDQLGDPQGARMAYANAYDSLQKVRQDLIAASPIVQFSFRDSVESIYRQYVDRLLTPDTPDPSDLRLSQDVIESLRLAELNNFFQDNCLDIDSQPQLIRLEETDRNAVVFYPILLPDRMEVILSLPDGQLRLCQAPIPRDRIEETLTWLRQTIENRTTREFRTYAEAIYDWLIKPALPDLDQVQPQTLVFVLDGSLRNVPMAALYDGQRFLSETYSIAITPGLKLLEPRPWKPNGVRALVAGLSEAHQEYPPLRFVETEIEQIMTQIPSRSLLNREFTNDQLFNQLEDFSAPIVHIASHGQFGSKADQTFILTWEGRLGTQELDGILREEPLDPSTPIRNRQPIELLTLSACQTAAGDTRAALGLAGVAVRAGARSTLASLWAVNDQSTSQFMTDVYRHLTGSPISKAKALQQAQLAMLNSEKFNHPYYWSPFILVGSWL